ncbi:MAG: mechanosensitive ion channel family protein [Lachnospiraceae bacterium]|nr:mechanosensitive ion channel family protein [Lachnospiraceae bacterium]
MIGISVIAFFFLQQWFLQNEAREEQEQNNQRYFASEISKLDSNNGEVKDLKKYFHENNRIMLDDLVEAYSGDNYKRLESMSERDQSDLLMNATATMENCLWMLIVNRDADIIISSNYMNNGLNVVEDGDIGITLEEYQEFCDGKQQYLEVDNPYYEEDEDLGTMFYLYCKVIPRTYGTDGYKYMLLGFSSKIIDAAEERMGDPDVWLNSSTIGNGGSVFMVDAECDLVTYGTLKGEDKTGSDASSLGFTPEILKDRYTGTNMIDGTSCYVSVRSYSSELYGEDNYIIITHPVSVMRNLNSSVILWNICFLLIMILLMLAYSSYVRLETLKNEEDLRGIRLFGKAGGNTIFSRSLAGKILPIVFTAVFLVFGATFYFHALIKLSDCFSESVAVEEEISKTVEESAVLRGDFLDYYNMQYVSRARLMSFIVSLNSSQYMNYEKGKENLNFFGTDASDNALYVINDSEALIKLMESNYVENIYLISDMGTTIATSSTFWNFSLSTDPEDQSYEFWDVLDGKVDYLAQDVMISDEGRNSQFIGCTLYYYTCADEDGNIKYVDYADYLDQEDGNYKGSEITRHRGLLQIELNPEDESEIMESARPEYVLAHTQISDEGYLIGFQYSEEDEDYVVFYSPISSMIDKTATELDFSENAFSGSYNGFHVINGMRCLQSFRQADDYFIATALPLEVLYAGCFRTAVFCALYSLFVLLLASGYTLFVGKMDEEELYREETDPLAIFGHLESTRGWKKKTPTQKFETLIRVSLLFLGIVFLVSIIIEAVGSGNNSAIVYIMSGEWDRGVHIFSLSACFVIILISFLLFRLFEHIVSLIAAVFGSRVVTMMKLCLSLIRAAVVLIVILYCLFLMGINATRLLASAGIMSVVVGLGAQSLVGDLLAGIFIVMEGSVHVGDYILINEVRGKVIDIGLRTTRYEDDNQNIRIICNNEMKSFINLSMKYSVVFYYIPVPYEEDYPKIRKILNEEFLQIYADHRFLKGIPSCLGIQRFSESSVDLCVRFMCDESERLTVQRFMYDQIMRIFMENDIHIPFNQIDVHFDREFAPENERDER